MHSFSCGATLRGNVTNLMTLPNLAGCAKKPKPTGQTQEALAEQVEAYFRQNSDRLIHISEINKALKKKVKREELVTLLEQAEWCKIVDATTFFYAPNH